MTRLFSTLIAAIALFAWSPTGMFAVYGFGLLIIDLLALAVRVCHRWSCGLHFAAGCGADAQMKLARRGTDGHPEADAVLLWLRRARALTRLPIVVAVCILGLALLMVGLFWGGVGMCGALFTGINVVYATAIQFCRWRLDVHLDRAIAAGV